MQTKEFQDLLAEITYKIDEKYGINRDIQLNISQLVEELGELAEAANKKKLRGKEPEKEELEDEFADVLLQVMTLADIFAVDVEKATLDKIETLKERHDL